MEKYKICDFKNRAYCIVGDVYGGGFFLEKFIPSKDYSCLEEGLYHFLLLHSINIPACVFVLYNFTVYFYDRNELLNIYRRYCNEN